MESLVELLRRVQSSGHRSDATRYAPAIHSWLTTIVADGVLEGVANFRSPTEGTSSHIIIFDATISKRGTPREYRYVLRRETSEDPTFPRLTEKYGASVELEYSVQRFLSCSSDVAVPRMIAYEGDPRYLGKPFYLCEFIDGRILPSISPMKASFLASEATSDERSRMIRGGLDQLVRIHALDWRDPGVDLLLSDSPVDPVLHHIEIYERELLRQLKGRSHPKLLAGIDWLKQHRPEDERYALCWGDARPSNIIFGTDYEVNAILDWEAAAILPFEADIGWWMFNDWVHHDYEGVDRLPGYPTRDEQIAYYSKQSGKEIRNLRYWMVLSAVKNGLGLFRIGDRLLAQAGGLEGACAFQYDNLSTEFLAENQCLTSP